MEGVPAPVGDEEVHRRLSIDAVVLAEQPVGGQQSQWLAWFGGQREAAAGTLMSYGPTGANISRTAAEYVAKILSGSKPADLPVEQVPPELVINMKTAKELGLTIPQSLLVRANEVIQ